MIKVLVIMGATSSGKSALGIELAKEYNGEIISCDSVQVYKGLDIGSAKQMEFEGIPHHLIDVLELEDPISVAHFQEMARKKIEEIHQRGKLPICVGGTGFYIKALLYDYVFSNEETNHTFDHLTNEELHKKLEEVDPIQAQKIHVNNRQRLLRVHQLMASTNKTRTEIIEKQSHSLLYDAKIYYLTLERELLKERINQRVDEMFKAGLLQEIENITHQGENFDYQGLSAIGYKEFKEYYSKEKTLDEVKEKIKTNTRQFSKRQMTWFKHQLNGTIVNRLNEQEVNKMKQEIAQWVNSNG